ncbi:MULTISPECIES: helix-turn-helix transcriptional regulator [unclassified Roseovarius]|uniref:helix-turn-helix domain-containing protein n=1 Tax=unclassified Roseovarius TaxID=2614913 RepID=UPI00273E7C4C|nr:MULTISPECIES: helix-turn-helix transcriptional regulator [unclassified Roseovarius]
MTPEQARAARAMLKVGVRDVAEATGVTPNTVSRIEAAADPDKRGPQASTIAVIEAWYVSQGLEFIPENGGGPGVRLKK